MPAIARESMACGVICKPALRIASDKPGVGRWITAWVASGVISRGAEASPSGCQDDIHFATISPCSQGGFYLFRVIR